MGVLIGRFLSLQSAGFSVAVHQALLDCAETAIDPTSSKVAAITTVSNLVRIGYSPR